MWLLGSTHQLSIPTLNSCMKGSELLYIDCSQSAKHLRLDLKTTFKKVKWFWGIGMGWEKVVIVLSPITNGKTKIQKTAQWVTRSVRRDSSDQTNFLEQVKRKRWGPRHKPQGTTEHRGFRASSAGKRGREGGRGEARQAAGAEGRYLGAAV